VRVRFILRTNNESSVLSTSVSDGFFIDDITVTDSTLLVNETTTPLAGTATSFTLNAATPGSALPQPAMAGNNYTVSFSQPAGVAAVNYGVQWSRNLASWSPVPNSGSGGNHIFSVSRLGESRMYFRYQIVVDP
jgi:hypothetical protein